MTLHRSLLGCLFLTVAPWAMLGGLALAQVPGPRPSANDQQSNQDSGENRSLGNPLRPIPDALKPWREWVTWSDRHQICPSPFNDATQHICFWPSQLVLSTRADQGSWTLQIQVFEETSVPLPGNADTWPMNVRTSDKAIAVVGVAGSPTARLAKGSYELTGEFHWEEMPQKITIPAQIGVLRLSIDGQEIAIPNWDQQGNVWLRRKAAEESDKDLLSADVYRVLEDGIPMWLRTDVELTVSGKSREESLGWILPEGWKLSMVDSPIPVAVDESGQVKAQVRAGKWTVSLQAFRVSDTNEIRFMADAEPVVDQELIGFQANPEFRTAEIEGLAAVDVTQTTFPEKWRGLPVYQWKTDTTFQLTEKMRGMGLKRPEGLSINRRLWLDEDGGGFTYRDNVTGKMQQVWRLDVAAGHDLGTVRVDGEAQLITANPQTNASGVEIRTRNVNLQAVGRIERTPQVQVSGWQTDADAVHMTLVLPPGWRALACFGADRVEGDWLTAWTLLDLFLLLIFSLAVFRLWGFWVGAVAFLAFGLAYHEPSAPRFTWLFLLMPVALLHVVQPGNMRKLIQFWKWLALLLLAVALIPFVTWQIQSAIYPQLEPSGTSYGHRGYFNAVSAPMLEPQLSHQPAAPLDDLFDGPREPNASFSYSRREGKPAQQAGRMSKQAIIAKQSSNLNYDAKAKIQTGPAEPEWDWNQVYCEWNGPVTADQQLRPILIPQWAHRWFTVIRIALLLALLGLLLRNRIPWRPSAKSTATVAGLLFLFMMPNTSPAQFPDPVMLETLRMRLLQPSEAFPNAAEIPFVELTVSDHKLSMKAEVHATAACAVPLPGKLPAWSPIGVSLDGQPNSVLCRKDGYLWLNVTAGVHQVTIEGALPHTSDWEWTFLLKPRQVTIAADGWTVTGVRSNGVPEQQIFFARKSTLTAGEAAYDRKEFASVVVLDRHLEIGLRWQLRNAVSRLSSSGKAVSVRIPLIEGEQVLSPNMVVDDGHVEVRLAIGQSQATWDSELAPRDEIQLVAAKDAAWIERWHLVTSPVWNAALSGLAPVFENQQADLVPVWHPWPGEQVKLAFSKPTAISGDTVTVQHIEHTVSVGKRQSSSLLKLDINCSLGDDFHIDLNSEAEISSLTREGQSIPVRRDQGKLVVPVQPGRQSVEVAWRTTQNMHTLASAGHVTLPVDGANATTVMSMPESRWILWADGPLRGPAVRFWAILACAIVVALVLGSVAMSPLSRVQWVLLALGLTQVHVVAALIVVAWFFLLAWRGRQNADSLTAWRFNGIQVAVVLTTFVVLGILVVAVGEGLLGSPKMFIVGNNSTSTRLNWFQPRVGPALPEPFVVSISVWFYRLLMLLWALWLANALLSWLKWGWNQFTQGGGWRPLPRREKPKRIAPRAS